MARQRLFVSAAVVLIAFLLPLVAARPGGRLCHTSFFFPDPNNVRTITVVGNSNGVPARFKLFPFASNGFFGSPSNLVEVRLLNLHSQMLLNPAFPHSLDLPHAGIPADKPLISEPDHNEIMQTWSFSTSKPHHPITWIDVHSRHALWRPDLTVPHVEQKPLHLDNDGGVWVADSVWVFATLFALGFGFFLMLVWALVRNFFVCAHEDHDDVGFLYGYQELPSPGESEKEVAQKEFAKKSTAEAENV